jgi:hypothetical protein
LKRIARYLATHALATTALIFSLLALAGGSYAAFTISGSQIQNHTIDPVKLNPRFIAGNARAWARVRPNGHLIAWGGGPRSIEQTNGVYVIDWKTAVGGHCVTTATVDASSSTPTERVSTPQESASFVAGYASAATTSHGRVRSTLVETFNQNGQATPLGFDVVVVC